MWKRVDFSAVAVWPFQSQGQEQISLNLGDSLHISDSYEGQWYKGENLSTGETGIFPTHGFVELRPNWDHTTVELDQTIREWTTLLKDYFQGRKHNDYGRLKKMMEVLIGMRKKLVNSDTPELVKLDLQAAAVSSMEEGRRLLGLDLVVKNANGETASETNTAIIQLYNLHRQTIKTKTPLLREGSSANIEVAASRPGSVMLGADQSPRVSVLPAFSPNERRMTVSQSILAQASTGLLSTSPTGPAEKAAVPPKQIMLCMKAFQCPTSEEVELNFYLYQQSKNCAISETYQVSLNKSGTFVNPQMANQLRTIYKDVPGGAALSDLWMICRVVKKGALGHDGIVGSGDKKEKDKKKSSKTSGESDLRKPFGVAALQLSTAKLRKHKETDQVVPIWYHTKDEANFANLVDLIIKKSRDIEKVPRSIGVSITLTMSSGSIDDWVLVDPAIRQVPVSLPLEHNPDDDVFGPRNDIFVTLKEATFDSAVAAEVNVSVRDASGRQLDGVIVDALSHTAGPISLHRSFVLHGASAPAWDETFIVRMTPEQLTPGTHLLFHIKNHATDKKEKAENFAFGKLDLITANNTIVNDQPHKIELFKLGKGVDLKKEPNVYLKEKPADSKKAKLIIRKDELLRVSTKLLSNQMTGNTYMHRLLNWSAIPPGTLIEVLGKLSFAGEEAIKFLPQTFDALFDILDAKLQVPNINDAVFNALVSVLEMLVDEKKQRKNMRPLLDVYIDTTMSSTTAQQHLIQALVRYFAAYETKKSNELIATLKSLEYLLRFVIQSRWLWMRSGFAVDDTAQFKAELAYFFSHMCAMLKNEQPQFVGAQTMAVKKLSGLFQLLLRIFNPDEVAPIASDFISSFGYNEANKTLNVEKLVLLMTFASGELFENEASRQVLLESFVFQIRQHLTSKSDDEQHLSIAILHQLILLAQTRPSENNSVAVALSSLLPELTAIVLGCGHLEPQRRYDTIMAYLGVLFLMTPDDFGAFLSSFPPSEQKHFLTDTFSLFGGMVSLKTPVFPDNWFVMNMFMFSTALKVVIVSAHFMQERIAFSAEEEDLWQSFFGLILSFVNSKVLDLESFTDAKRNLVLERYGDARDSVIQILQLMWQLLDAQQIVFLESLTEPFLQLSALEQSSLADKGQDLYISLLQREWSSSKTFLRLEKITLDTIDSLFPILMTRARILFKDADQERTWVKDWLSRGLSDKLTSEDDFGKAARSFVKDMTLMLELVYDLRTVPEGTAWEDDRTAAILRLLEYLKSTHRLNTYTQYVHKLVSQHTAAGNYSEAAFALLLHSDIIDWGDQTIEPPIAGFPTQPATDRKIALINNAMQLLDKGKMWESCMNLTNELRQAYERVLFRYEDVSDLLALQSNFHRNIVSVERFFCEYFRVGFYGKGMPFSVRNKTFIYRGLELERLADFIARISANYPDAKLLTFTEPPGEDITLSEGQHLQIFAVKSSHVNEMEGKPHPKVKKGMNANIQKYYLSNEVNCFVYSKPFRKNKQKGETMVQEYADLWIRKTYYISADQFPTVQRRSEVVQQHQTETHPVTNALTAIADKNREIAQMTFKFEAGQVGSLAPFTMVLKGVIDAAVNGGSALYRSAFLNEDFLKANTTRISEANQLRKELLSQVDVLFQALKVHAKICPPEMIALQEQLDVQYMKMVQEVKGAEKELVALFDKFKPEAVSLPAIPEADVPPPDGISPGAVLPSTSWKQKGGREIRVEIATKLVALKLLDITDIANCCGLPISEIKQITSQQPQNFSGGIVGLNVSLKDLTEAAGRKLIASGSGSSISSKSVMTSSGQYQLNVRRDSGSGASSPTKGATPSYSAVALAGPLPPTTNPVPPPMSTPVPPPPSHTPPPPTKVLAGPPPPTTTPSTPVTNSTPVTMPVSTVSVASVAPAEPLLPPAASVEPLVVNGVPPGEQLEEMMEESPEMLASTVPAVSIVNAVPLTEVFTCEDDPPPPPPEDL